MIIVSAASGKTGSELVRQLKSARIEHVGLSRNPQSDQRLFDWSDSSTWNDALAGGTSLYLVKPPHTAEMATQVSELLEQSPQLTRVVMMSEWGRQSKGEDDLDKAIETIVRNSGREWTILAPGWFMQNFSVGGVFYQGLLDGVINIPTGPAPLTWVDVRDVMEVAVSALTSGNHVGEVLSLAAEIASVDELAEQFTLASGHEVRPMDQTPEQYLAQLPNPGSVANRYYSELITDVLAGNYLGDIGELPRLLGREPRMFTSFIKEHQSDWW